MPSPPVTSPGAHLTQHDERLPFLDDIRGELGRVAAADILHLVVRSVRDEQDLAGLEGHRRPAVEPILQDAFNDVDELFAWMIVPRSSYSRGKSTRT